MKQRPDEGRSNALGPDGHGLVDAMRPQRSSPATDPVQEAEEQLKSLGAPLDHLQSAGPIQIALVDVQSSSISQGEDSRYHVHSDLANFKRPQPRQDLTNRRSVQLGSQAKIIGKAVEPNAGLLDGPVYLLSMEDSDRLLIENGKNKPTASKLGNPLDRETLWLGSKFGQDLSGAQEHLNPVISNLDIAPLTQDSSEGVRLQRGRFPVIPMTRLSIDRSR